MKKKIDYQVSKVEHKVYDQVVNHIWFVARNRVVNQVDDEVRIQVDDQVWRWTILINFY